MNRDPFEVLGVSPSSTEDEIKSAYRKLAKKYHPDLNPGDKAAEQKMKEVNEAYSEALRLKKTGGTWQGSQGSGAQGGYGNPFGGSYGNGYRQGGYGSYGGQGYGPYGSQGSYGGGQQYQGNPFEGFGFDPFADFFGGGSGRTETGFRTRTYANPELKTVENHVLTQRYQDAMNLLNLIPDHGADWHALYARADLGMGNRISALDHAKQAVRMAPGDMDYQDLLNKIEMGRQTYQRTRQSGGYTFWGEICSNPFLSCCAINIVLNCCLGGRFICC